MSVCLTGRTVWTALHISAVNVAVDLQNLAFAPWGCFVYTRPLNANTSELLNLHITRLFYMQLDCCNNVINGLLLNMSNGKYNVSEFY